MSGRGMKKWAPFASLNEQVDYVNSTIKKKNEIAKPLISSEEAEIINSVLVNYHDEERTITYFEFGKIIVVNSKISKIDVIEKNIVLGRKKISFKNILKIE